ncbi:MAG TPA: dTDP-4-dehydrorhamnose reductase [Dongiaceae bacterium]|nr:dTDP-4-dehydrorhamnose reductase [Dongiaceae bacterium]
MADPATPRPMVIGASGLLGRALTRRLEAEFPETVAATRAEADVTDRFRLEMEIERLNPTVVINCAAFTDVDGCTREPERARTVNAIGAENAARAAAASGCRLVQISTDYVFDGVGTRPYVEDDPVGPIQEYGRSKLDGERRVATAAPDHLIVRTAWLFGRDGGAFVTGIRRRALAGEPLRVVSDQTGSPTFVDDLADGIARLLRVEHRGVVHLVNRGVGSRLEMTEVILAALGLAGKVAVTPVAARELFPAADRPAYTALSTGLYERLTGAMPRAWQQALADALGGGAFA